MPASALDNYKADDVWNDFGTIWPIGYSPSTPFQGAKRVFGESLLQSYYDGSKTFAFHYDDNGYVTQVDCEKSGKTTSSTIVYGDEILVYRGTSQIGTASLNDRGFISRMYLNEGSEELKIKYNDDDQIVEVDFGNGEVCYLTYTNGNVTQVTKNNKVINFYYETETQGKIENTGQIMEFERIFGLDMDDIEPFYFAGALGKATTHLPLSSSTGENIVGVTWTLDSQGRGSKAVITDGKTLRWDWGEGGDTPSTSFQGAKRVFGDNLLQTVSDGRLHTYTYDANGFLTSIERKTSEGIVDKVFKVSYGDNITFTYSNSAYTITLNERGFVKSCDYLDDNEHAEFRYNDDDQLVYVDWDGHITSITYTDGNITRVVDGDDVYDFGYETATQGKIENKAHIMEFDGIFQVDLDYFGLLYYGGFLGKATTHLPLTVTRSGITITGTWTLDSKGYGVHLDGGSDKESLSWSWAEGGDAPSEIISGSCGENATYSLSPEGTLTLSGTGAIYDYGTNNQPWKDYTSRIADLIIGEGITGIGENAFNGCSGITSITLPLSVTAVGNNAFYGCKLRSVVARQTDPQNYRSAFSGLTYIHALLYVPQSTYWDYVYVGEWGTFIHIREYATTTQARQAYMLADETGTVYTVFNGESGALADVDVENGISEDELGNNWVVESYGARQSLLNLGANKYARFDENGTMSLSDTPQSMDIVIENGVADFNGRQMMLVINEDETVTKVVEARYSTNAVESGDAPIYDLSGRRLMKKPSSGFYIKNGKKYVVK